MFQVTKLHQQVPRGFMFNLDFLKKRLLAFGFELMPTEDNQPYLLTVVPKSLRSLMDTLRVGPRMWPMFNKPPFDSLTPKQKQSLVDKALQKTVKDNPGLQNLPSVEAFVSFAFKKVS